MNQSSMRGHNPLRSPGWAAATFLSAFLAGANIAVGQESGSSGQFVDPTVDQDAEPTEEELRQLMNEKVINYLANEKVVAAGVGFINAQLGDPMNSVLDIWGEPTKMRKTGLLGDIEFLYQNDPSMAIVFTGDDYVKSVSIKGTSAAPFRTIRGARFGMPAIDIARIYTGEESEIVRNRFEFQKLGIDFHFMDDKLDKVVVYEPK